MIGTMIRILRWCNESEQERKSQEREKDEEKRESKCERQDLNLYLG
jgi:hypothetical protein